MARPRRKDGFIPLSHELGKAIALANFSKWAQVLLLEILTQIFNLERTIATVDLKDLADRHHADAGNIRSASLELQHAGAISKTGTQQFNFHKDYEQWNRNGAPRLTSAEAREAKETPKNIAAALKAQENIAQKDAEKGVQRDAQKASKGTHFSPTKGVQRDAQKASKGTHSAKPKSVQRDAFKASKGTHSETAPPSYKAHADAPPELETLETEESERDLHARENEDHQEQAKKPGPNTAAEIQETFDLADLLFPWTSYPPLAKRLCRTTRAVWIQDAMIAASRDGKTPRTWNYITAIVDGYRKHGISPSEESEQIQPEAGSAENTTKPKPRRFTTFTERENEQTNERRTAASKAIQDAITKATGTKS